MWRHELTYAPPIAQGDGSMKVVATCTKCKREHIKVLLPDAVQRIALSDQRTTRGIENQFDMIPCTPEQG